MLRQNNSKILPPYSGEMGFEITSFLGRVEPWLRNGWKILARRPELYPLGTAFYDSSYFLKEKYIVQKYNGWRSHYFYDIPEKNRDFDREIRELFSGYLQAEDRPLTVWDEMLLTSNNYSPLKLIQIYCDVTCPSYLPNDFLNPKWEYQHHIGVQMRYLLNDQGRNSDPNYMMEIAETASKYLGLPILVYGHPEGTLLPDGYIHTVDLGVDGLLARELGYLRNCRLMVSPDSGWANLMAWLRVPALIEKQICKHVFHWLKPFKPRIDIVKRDVPLPAQIQELLSKDECLPEPYLGISRGICPESIAQEKQKFLKLQS